ncbi:MAG: 4-hydroxythreonine-4-phosphate dehydrogenase PdxA [Paraprevotella sp.]|nr:4-hydroxythreonine-4-phosphate dehydrogenase PdxA [Paraprevotella sp.]
MENRRIRVGITHGDINGVGYEVILKTFADTTMAELCTPIVYGSPKVLAYHRKALESSTNFQTINVATDAVEGKLNLLSCTEEEIKIDFGKPTAESGKAALLSLECAMKDYKEGLIDVLVTAPINKNCIQSDVFRFSGHTEYIQACVGEGAEALMILMNENLRVALVTTHLPLKDIPAAITQEGIEAKLRIFLHTLKQDFTISKPRIAVLALNPHAGEEGLLGSEEKEIIIPAMKAVDPEGTSCFGPFPADGFFGSRTYEHFDGILAMYHDQGLAPFKTLAMEDGVNYTAGLSIVRTSPAHGTAYDIAGKGCADENSFRQAIYTAIDVYRSRQAYAEAHARPLAKVYHERRDDSDKLKLNSED